MKAPERTVARIAKAGLWLLVMLLLTVGLLSGSAVGAYEPRITVGSVDQDPVQSEGAMIRMAPQHPPDLEPLAPGTGFIPPPMDLSHLTGQRMLDATATLALPSEWDWRDMGMVTPVRNQAACGSCYAFGTIANFESKMLMDGAGTFDFSENHAKECNWRELNNFQYPAGTPWGSCHGGNAFMLASLFSQTGTVLESCDPYVASDVACASSCPYEKTLLDWRLISADEMPDTDMLKQYIYDHGPVITSMYADSSQGFSSSYNGSFTFNYAGPGTSTNHLVLIVGWSDNLPPVPGDTALADGWIVKNSWGTGWGASGYFYVTYGAANTGLWSSYIQDWQDYDADGDLWYYDDDGWWTSYGYGTTTAWALARFIPDENTYATRVEFWTTDATSDIDVNVYDDFNGSTPSNLLASELNRSFSEAGYHSVALTTPVSVTSGDDVIVVVKFTNVSYIYPIVADPHGTIETRRTYLSRTGSSWTDMGVNAATDLAIRLRTSVGSDGTVTLAKTVINDDGGTLSEADFQPHLDGSPVSWDTAMTVSPGTHTVTETIGPGYEPSAWGGDCEAGGALTVAPGGVYTCTITNDDIAPTVTLIKTVVNDDGGSLTEGDFQPYLDGGPVSWDTLLSLSPGGHVVSETQVSGYTSSVWGGDCTDGGLLTVELGGTYTCTVTNDDVAASVTLTKTVVNDNGGTLSEGDFEPLLDGAPVSWDTSLSLSAGSHAISETPVSGYAASSWGGNCASDGALTAVPGGTYTCTVTNDDVAPTLMLVKSVVNNDGGTLAEEQFPAYIGSSPAEWGVRYELDAGSYLVREDEQFGYEASPWSGDCAFNGTVSLQIGDEETCYITNDDIAPTVTLTKTVVNDDGGTLADDDFLPHIDGTPASWGDPVTLISGTHTVSETQFSGYAASSWGGDCVDDGSLTVVVGGVYTCTVTNDDIGPTVTLTKTVINDSGGSMTMDDFLPYVDGSPVSWDTPLSLSAGTHVVSETEVAGYAALSWAGDCDADGTLATMPGGTYTCTITNDDIAPTVTLTKTVFNDDGGTLTEDDFQPYVDGGSVSWGTPVPVLSGTHTVSETQVPGYASSGWAGACAPDGTLTVEVGGVYTCTIDNNDIAPTVTLTKTVSNDDGGTLTENDFRPYVDGSPVFWDTPLGLSAGTHVVSETEVAGYTALSWGGDCDADGILATVPGGTYTCTITNDDVGPTVTLTKTVINDNGGSLTVDDFVPHVGGSPVSWDTPVPLAPGTHTVSETQSSGYAISPWGGNCAGDGTLTAEVGGVYTCTVTNNDVPASVVLTKTVVNNNGGTFTKDDFRPYLDGAPVSWDTTLLLPPGSHTVSETEVLGYAASYWGGSCAGDGGLIVELGGTYTCTITNDDIAPTVTLTKTVINDDGGTLAENDFRPYVDGIPVSWDTPVPLSPGIHTVTETLVAGYDASTWGGDCADSGSLTMELGKTYTCTVTNDDVAASVMLSKIMINDDGGNLTEDDFQPHVDGSPVAWDTPVPLSPGSHTVTETVVAGYDASTWGGSCADDGSLIAELGKTYTCTVTNDDVAASVTLSKIMINDDGGTLTESDFQPYLDGHPASWDVTMSLEPGTHTISETEVTGYAASPWEGDCESDGTLTVALGGAYTCAVTNDDVAPTLMLGKSVVNNDGGTLAEEQFPAYVGSSPAEWDVRYELDAGTYLVKEDQQFGYTASSWSGDCAFNGTVSLQIGDEKTCYITNDDIAPTVTLTKTVVNDDGGTLSEDDFQPYIDGSPALWGVPVEVISGTHSVSETQAAGYAASSWAGSCEEDGTLATQVGGVYTCSVTNDDLYVAPTVALLKTVINDDGGTLTDADFQPHLDGKPVFWYTPVAVLSGTHSVSETQILGYAASSWGGDCETDGTLTAAPAGVYTCTVTNDDIGPTVILTKTVVNSHGGTRSAGDFQPHVDGAPVSWGVAVTLLAGSHTVSETQAFGYAASAWAGDCAEDGSLVAEVGSAYTCTIANSDIAPTVTLSKSVINDDGGTLSEDDFQPYINGTAVSWDNPVMVFSGTLTISETEASGYASSLWSGDCETDGTLTAELGRAFVCSVINDDRAGSVTLVKTVVNDDGGTLSEGAFHPYIDGRPVSWGMPVPLAAGTHTVSETEVLGYSASYWGGDCAEDGALVVDLGGVYTCTVTNDDIRPTVTLSKTVVNDNGGTLTRGDFYPYLDGSSVSWGASIPLSAGSHTVSETQVSGYAGSAWGGDCTAGGSLVAVLGGAYICIVTNDDIGPAVTSIAPNTGVSTGTIDILDLAGSDFQLGATVKLVKTGQPDIHASDVNVESASKITCSFDLNGAVTGRWSVVVTNPDSRVGVLPEGIMVYPPDGHRFWYLPLVMRH